MPWEPEQYLKFQAARFAPFDDLAALIRVRPGLTALDLGCGTGELTRRLAERLPESRVTGMDSSPEMLEKACTQARQGLEFIPGRVEDVAGSWDLVFSHAVLHWVDDHATLIPRLVSFVRPGGQLAVQIPANHRHPAHLLIPEIAGEEPFRSAMGGWSRVSPVLEIDAYAMLLHRAGCPEMTVLEKVYPSLMPDADAVAEWTKGSTLVPYLERLPKELHGPFMDRYRERLRLIWPAGPVFYTFRRILFVATAP